jgi:hypothetical protein
MDVAKSLFASRDHAGYASRTEHNVSRAETCLKYVSLPTHSLLS